MVIVLVFGFELHLWILHCLLSKYKTRELSTGEKQSILYQNSDVKSISAFTQTLGKATTTILNIQKTLEKKKKSLEKQQWLFTYLN